MFRAWSLFAAMILVAGALACFGLLAWRISSTSPDQFQTLKKEVATALGLEITMAEPAVFRLFPRPSAVLSNIELRDPDGTVLVNVPSAEVTLSPAALLQGQVALRSVRLVDPTGILDLDTLAKRWTGIAVGDRPSNGWIGRLPPKLIIVGGVLQIRAQHPAESGLLTDIAMAIRGLSDGPITLNGRGSWHGSHTEIAAEVGPLQTLMDGGATPGQLKIRSRELTLSVKGSFTDGWRGHFSGSVAASTASVPAMLRWAGLPALGAGGVRRASFNGSAQSSEEGLVFSDARLLLNTTAFEGTIGLQGNGGLVGTLATDDLDLAGLLAGFPPPYVKAEGWNDDRLDFTPADLHDTDLRISANRLRIGAFTAQDAAISALCRNGRLELSLGEARAYGGLVKGRLSATAFDRGVQVRMDLSASRLTLGDMDDVFRLAPDSLDGSGTIHATLEGRGESVRGIVASASGHGQVSIRQGRTSAIRHLDDASKGPITAFDLLTAEWAADQGVVRVKSGGVETADGHLQLAGQASLLNGRLALAAEKGVDNGATSDGSALTPTLLRGAERQGLPHDRFLSPAEIVPGGYFP